MNYNPFVYYKQFLYKAEISVLRKQDLDSVVDDDYFNKTLDQQNINRFGIKSHLMTVYLKSYINKMLAMSKKNELLLSQQFLLEIETLLAKISASEFNDVITQVFLIPAKAYLYYKLKDYENALSLLILAIKKDDDLTKDIFGILHYHKLQQINNVARIKYAQKKHIEWADIMLNCINYTYGGDGEGLLAGSILQIKNIEEQRLLSAFRAQLINELIIFDFYSHQGLAQKLAESIVIADPEGVSDEYLTIWANQLLVKSYIPGEVNENLVKLFKNADSSYDVLKFSILTHEWLTGNYSAESYYLFADCIELLSIPKNLIMRFKADFSVN